MQKDVIRLYVSMDYACRVCFVESVADRQKDLCAASRQQAPHLFKLAGECAPFEQFHYQVCYSCRCDIEIEDRDGVWMIHAACRDSLKTETFDALYSRIAGSRTKYLYRYRTIQC